jgi:hypothetical protein
MFVTSIRQEEIENLKNGAFEGEIHVIDSLGKEYNEAIRYLKNKEIIGFDTETKPCFSPGQNKSNTALLQLSGSTKAFLFRINKIGMDPKLCRILADEKIVKVGAAVNDDIRGLQKWNNFKPAGFIDLQKIVSEYGIRDKSVKKMAAIIMGIRISKTQQLSNWEAEQLSYAQQLYAATDAWVCREMFKVLSKSEKHPLIEIDTLV